MKRRRRIKVVVVVVRMVVARQCRPRLRLRLEDTAGKTPINF